MKDQIPKYFGFEGAGILLRDVKTDFVFTLNELSREEKEDALRQGFRTAESREHEMELKYNYEAVKKQLSKEEMEELEQQYVD